MSLFSDLLKTLDGFSPEDPIVIESQLESLLKDYLKNNNYIIESQVSKKGDRYDLICKRGNETVCLELKMRAECSDLEQFDRYLPKFRNGLIVVCWQAAFSVQDIFKDVQDQSPIPVTMIELSKRYMA